MLVVVNSTLRMALGVDLPACKKLLMDVLWKTSILLTLLEVIFT